MPKEIQTQQPSHGTLRGQVVTDHGRLRHTNPEGADTMNRDQRLAFDAARRDELNALACGRRLVPDCLQHPSRGDGVGGPGVQRHADELLALGAFQQDINRNERLGWIERKDLRRRRHTPWGGYHCQRPDKRDPWYEPLVVRGAQDAWRVPPVARLRGLWFDGQDEPLRSRATRGDADDESRRWVGSFVRSWYSVVYRGVVRSVKRVSAFQPWRQGRGADPPSTLHDGAEKAVTRGDGR